MKKFMRRVDQEKRRILLEEVPKQSASASKRKEKFKMVKLKRKLKKAGKLDSLDEVTPFYLYRRSEFLSLIF